jgi:hypothetical protein
MNERRCSCGCLIADAPAANPNRLVELCVWLRDIVCGEYRFEVVSKGDDLFLLARYDEADVHTGVVEVQTTRKWIISPHATHSEFIQTAFKCVLTSMEHRTREMFRYKGAQVYGPHIDVEALMSICNQTEVRHPTTEQLLKKAAGEALSLKHSGKAYYVTPTDMVEGVVQEATMTITPKQSVDAMFQRREANELVSLDMRNMPDGEPIETYNLPYGEHALLLMDDMWYRGYKQKRFDTFVSLARSTEWDTQHQPTRWKPLL